MSSEIILAVNYRGSNFRVTIINIRRFNLFYTHFRSSAANEERCGLRCPETTVVVTLRARRELFKVVLYASM